MKRREFLLSCAASLAGCRSPLAPADDVDLMMMGAGSTRPLRTGLEARFEPVLGINSHVLADDDLRLVRELGFTHVRSTLISTMWAKYPGYAVSIRERTARTLDHGLQMLYVVHNADGPTFRMRNDRPAARGFTTIVEQMVRYLPEVESWQLWNEQDVWLQAPFGSGASPQQPALFVGANYGRWWNEAYTRLKNIRPDAKFITGGTADHSSNRWRDFVKGMTARELQADGIAIHIYGSWERAWKRLNDIRRIVGPDMPVWLTECGGVPGNHWSPSYQATSLRSFIEGNARERIFERIYPYCLETDPQDPWYGLRNVDGTDRPVLQWLQERAAGLKTG